MKPKPILRRDFLKTSSAGALAFSLQGKTGARDCRRRCWELVAVRYKDLPLRAVSFLSRFRHWRRPPQPSPVTMCRSSLLRRLWGLFVGICRGPKAETVLEGDPQASLKVGSVLDATTDVLLWISEFRQPIHISPDVLPCCGFTGHQFCVRFTMT